MIKTTGILVEEYKSYRNPKMKIGRLVKERKLIPIIRGLYETDDSVPGYLLANIIYGPSYLSFEFALSWYDLIPEAVFTITSASFSKKKNKRYDTFYGCYTSMDVPQQVFPYGKKYFEENNYGFIIASKEKAICDQLYKCHPCSNKTELKALLFDNLRIDENSFWNTDLEQMEELANLYNTKNHKLLLSLLNEGK